ncbi:MAG TPA: hypothetical protein ENJ18_11300, partial [Nannocystis exedens]|nr:hypothetical protein [Nannocystis exedens]
MGPQGTALGHARQIPSWLSGQRYWSKLAAMCTPRRSRQNGAGLICVISLALAAALVGVQANASASPPGLVLDRVKARQMPLSSLRGVIEQSTISL